MVPVEFDGRDIVDKAIAKVIAEDDIGAEVNRRQKTFVVDIDGINETMQAFLDASNATQISYPDHDFLIPPWMRVVSDGPRVTSLKLGFQRTPTYSRTQPVHHEVGHGYHKKQS